MAGFLDVIDDTLAFVKFRQLLAEEAKAHSLADDELACTGRQIAGNDLEQCRFANAVGADNADAVVLNYVIRHVVEQGLAAGIGKGHAVHVDDGLAKAHRRIEDFHTA